MSNLNTHHEAASCASQPQFSRSWAQLAGAGAQKSYDVRSQRGAIAKIPIVKSSAARNFPTPSTKGATSRKPVPKVFRHRIHTSTSTTKEFNHEKNKTIQVQNTTEPYNECIEQSNPIPLVSKPTYAEILKKTPPHLALDEASQSPTISTATLDSWWTVDFSNRWSLPSSPASSEVDPEEERRRLEIEKAKLEEELEVERYGKWLLAHTVVDDEPELHNFISTVDEVAVDYDVDLFIDAEGGSGHGRHCSLNFIQVKSASLDQSWLLDVQKLGAKIFNTAALTGKKRTFRDILEDDKIPVVFYDVRADSDSIYRHFGVHMKGVIDLQLMEVATRPYSRDRLHSLDKCIESLPFTMLPSLALTAWNRARKAGKQYCSNNGGYGAFDIRPIAKDLQDYAVNDATLMPMLFTYYSEGRGLCKDEDLMRLVLKITTDRVTASVAPNYAGNSPDHKYGPVELRNLLPDYDSDGDLWDYY